MRKFLSTMNAFAILIASAMPFNASATEDNGFITTALPASGQTTAGSYANDTRNHPSDPQRTEAGEPSKVVEFTLNGSFNGSLYVYVGMEGASDSSPKTFYADYGRGRNSYQSKSDGIPSSPSMSEFVSSFFGVPPGGTVSIFIPEGETMTALSIGPSIPLTNIDVTKATGLRNLSVVGCSIEDIDLSYNSSLQTLSIQGNKLTRLDLAGADGDHEKKELSNINASKNQIAVLNITDKSAVRNLNLSGNQFTEFDLKDFDNIEVLDLSNNALEGDFDLSGQAAASSIDISSNRIKSLKYDGFDNLRSFNISKNNLTLQTIPYMPEVEEYTYAPMNYLQLPENAPSVNLSDQNRVIDGNGTAFVWKKSDTGTLLVEGTDVTCTDGITKFLKTNLGRVYCEMSNPAFPQFEGSSIYRTTDVNVISAPTTVIASFTTLEDSDNGTVSFTGADNTVLYVDWRGDGTEFLPYSVETAGVSYTGQHTFAGANVKVYTYGQPDEITALALSSMPLGEADLTPLTGLTALAVRDAGLSADKMKLPQAALKELNLAYNALTEYPFSEQYPELTTLNLSGNKFTGFDATKLTSLTDLRLANNEIASVTFNNPGISELDLDFNKLEAIDLSGLNGLTKLSVSNNMLEAIDLTPVKSSIAALNIVANRLTFATLPVPSGYPALTEYFYGSQASVEPVVSTDRMTFDLSSQAAVGDSKTTYRWFLGEAAYDQETGTLSGKELIQDKDYTVKDGVTTFLTRFDEKVMCAMTNPLFPDTYMQTPLCEVGMSGIEGIYAGDADKPVDVCTIQGTVVKRQVSLADALEGLSSGLYIIGGKKVIVK